MSPRRPATTEQLLKVKEFADRVRVHPETVREWLRTGKVRGSRLGGDRAGWRIPESEVQRLVTAGTPTDTST